MTVLTAREYRQTLKILFFRSCDEARFNPIGTHSETIVSVERISLRRQYAFLLPQQKLIRVISRVVRLIKIKVVVTRQSSRLTRFV